MASPQRRSHRGTGVLRAGEHALKLAEEVFDVGAALGEVDEEVLRSRKVRLLQIADNQHLRVVVLRAITGYAEVRQGAVDCHESESGPAVGVGYPVQALQNASRSSRQKSARDASKADVEQKQVNQRLWSANHVFLRRNEFAHRVVELRTLPPVHGLLLRAVPVETLRNVVRQVTHVATPPMRVIQETCERVDVCPASSATCDDLIVLDRDIVLRIVKRGVWLDDEREWKLALFEKGGGRGHGIEGRSNVFGRAVCVRRGSYRALFH